MSSDGSFYSFLYDQLSHLITLERALRKITELIHILEYLSTQ